MCRLKLHILANYVSHNAVGGVNVVLAPPPAYARELQQVVRKANTKHWLDKGNGKKGSRQSVRGQDRDEA
uniref:Uncharacterized protein n=1 Tax=Knipowitschia caucasica TaxID=637954 RepID=A0AAV2JK09_KNICA